MISIVFMILPTFVKKLSNCDLCTFLANVLRPRSTLRKRFCFWNFIMYGVSIANTVHCAFSSIPNTVNSQYLGKLPKQIFGKSWEFGPRRGGALTQSQLFSKLTKT